MRGRRWRMRSGRNRLGHMVGGGLPFPPSAACAAEGLGGKPKFQCRREGKAEAEKGVDRQV